MKKKKVLSLAVLLTAGCLLFTGCGGGKGAADSNSVATEEYAAEYATDDVYEEAAMDSGSNATNSLSETGVETKAETETVAANRKLIKNVNMTVETEEFDALIQKLNDKVESLGGYMESSYVSGSSITAGYDSSRNASFTARIPKDKLDGFVTEVANMSNVLNKSENVEDVTLSYVDLESRKETLEIEKERLNDLLAQADSIETIIALESRLTDIRYQLESMESQLRTYDNLVDYATVSLEVQEVERMTQVAPKSAFEKMKDGFLNSIYNIGKGFKNFGIGFVIVLPYLIVWALIIFIFIMIVRTLIRRNQKKAEKKQALLRSSMKMTNGNTEIPKESSDFGGKPDENNNLKK